MACMSTATETAKKESVPDGSYAEPMTAQLHHVQRLHSVPTTFLQLPQLG